MAGTKSCTAKTAIRGNGIIVEHFFRKKLQRRMGEGRKMAEEMTAREGAGEKVSRNFIEMAIDKDLAEGVYDHVTTRFPPEPNGYLHIGHAKSILLNYGLSQEYGGEFHLRFDDTNPTKEKDEFVEAIRGSLTEPGEDDPNRNRPAAESLQIFEDMRAGKYEDGAMVIRARIDMTSPNINMRDPILYRVAHMEHHRQGDTWCIYPMYDFAHPIEDAIEGVSHSICTLEFEDHRPLYDWVVDNCGFEMPPRQIEFAKMYLRNVVTGKRYIKRLVEDGIVDGWDDPRLVSIAALRRRGFTPESIRMFVELTGVSKANSAIEYPELEYCIREDLKGRAKRMMAALDPVRLVIDNYPKGQSETLIVPNNKENPELGEREVTFSGELYIDRDDFMEVPAKKYRRMYPGNEVRLMNAYYVTCTSCEKDEDGRVTVIHCNYDPATRGGDSADGRKVRGTIHWVDAATAKKVSVRLYENIIDEDKGVYNEDGSLNLNPNSLTVREAYVEAALAEAEAEEKFQFVRQGFFVADLRDSRPGAPVFNRIVGLKSSYRLPGQK